MNYFERNEKNPGQRSFLKGILPNSLVILAVIILVFATSVCAAGKALVSSTSFADGSLINGIDLSGKSYDEGRSILEQSTVKRLETLDIKLDYNGELVVLRASELGFGYDIDAAMEELSPAGSGSGFPLLKYIRAVFYERSEAGFTIPLVYDKETLIGKLTQSLSPYDVDPENAKFLFNEDTAEIEYLPEIVGRRAEIELMSELVIKSVEGKISSPIVVLCEAITPEQTMDELMQNTSLIAECIVPLPSSANAAENLRIACAELNGTAIRSGEIFSLCGQLAKPTLEHGYKLAPDVCEGESHDELNGGICRLSGALYNAALLTNMEIVSRAAHSFAPDYFPAGLDAVIDWAGKDLKIKNSSDFAIYIAASVDDGSLAVRLYGETLIEGLTIKVATEQIREIEAPEAAGSPGSEVAAYRNYYINGSLESSELISRDIYNPVEVSVSSGTGSGGK